LVAVLAVRLPALVSVMPWLPFVMAMLPVPDVMAPCRVRLRSWLLNVKLPPVEK